MKGLQEKFQTILPPQPFEDDGTEWVDRESARRTYEPGQRHQNNANAEEVADGKFNEMPVNMDNKNQNPLLRQIAGCTDFSYDTTPESFTEGYRRHPMKGSDDQEFMEHMDHFYGTAVDEQGKEGFVERNNYLDRS
jgi:hypothetical protein